MKQEFKIISTFIEKNTRVLDVGCGDGTLMDFLKDNKKIDIRGIEISKNNSQKCVSKGLTVIEGDAEKDLSQFPDGSCRSAVPARWAFSFHLPAADWRWWAADSAPGWKLVKTQP